MSNDFEEILLPIKSKLKKMENYIEQRFKKDHFFIAKVGKYVVQSGGKRIRPVLMLIPCVLENTIRMCKRCPLF